MTGHTQKYKYHPAGAPANLLFPHVYQDTSSTQIQPAPATIIPLLHTRDSINTGIIVRRKFTAEDIDSIFRIADSKKQTIDSIISNNKLLQKIKTEAGRPDSSELARLPYNLQCAANEVNTPVNLLNNLKTGYFYVPDTGKPVFFEDANPIVTPGRSTSLEISREKPGEFFLPVRNKPNPDWILLIFIVTLAVIAWLKLFYNKFFDQTIQSVFNYQLSTKVFRDQNIFSRHVALVLNLNFIFTVGMFFFLVFNYFGYIFISDSGIIRYFLICGIITLLLLTRYCISFITGLVFNRNSLLKEYLHEILLTYKNMGIYMIPIVIGLAYISSYLKIYLIYIGLVLLIVAYLWRFFKGLQIIINKDIIIFYLILYLCILEILPVLVAYRFVKGLL